MDLKQFFTGYKGKDIPKELKEFNWGAFLLTFIWGIKHKAWITLLAIPLIWFQLPFGLNWILYTALQVYCGIKGNEWAYQVEWWKTPRDFRKTQQMWAISALALNIIIPFVILTIASMFLKKSPNNPELLIQNAQCVVAYGKLKTGLPKVSYTTKSTDADIAKSFAKHFKNASAAGNAVNFSQKAQGQKYEVYKIVFTKHVDNVCSLSAKNCTAYSSYIMPNDIMPFGECIFYFDNNKNVEPDEATQKAIDKGFNIFKYL